MRFARALIVLASAAGLQQLPSQTLASKARSAPLALDELGQEPPSQAMEAQAMEAQAMEDQEMEAQAMEAQAMEAQVPASELPSQAPSQAPEILRLQDSLRPQEVWVPCARGRCLDANLIFIRLYKTASSTFSSILKRIGDTHGVNGIDQWTANGVPEPLVSTGHYSRTKFYEQDFVKKLGEFTKRNVFITLVREPVARALSAYYYARSIGKFDGTELEFLTSSVHLESNFMQNFLTKRRPVADAEPDQTVGDYDFIGVTERFDESVVALMFTLGLDSYCELLFTNSKSSKSGTDKTGKAWIPSKTLEEQSPEVKQYVDSPEFQIKVAKDKKLYHLANERLDKFIDKIGRPLFERRLQEFVHLKNTSQMQCDADDQSEFDPKNCYVRDLGCNHKCLDTFCREHQQDMTPNDAQ